MRPSLLERFWAKVDKSGDCWLWTAVLDHRGYGHIRVGDRMASAHRTSWELAFGPIPAGPGYHGTCVLHRCDTPRCVRPEHLFLGTNEENMADMVRKNRQAKQRGDGHPSSKISSHHVAVIRALHAWGVPLSLRRLAEMFRVSPAEISHVRNRRNWRSV
jgi:hypothetical protein